MKLPLLFLGGVPLLLAAFAILASWRRGRLDAFYANPTGNDVPLNLPVEDQTTAGVFTTTPKC